MLAATVPELTEDTFSRLDGGVEEVVMEGLEQPHDLLVQYSVIIGDGEFYY
jgi:hypothetical protein